MNVIYSENYNYNLGILNRLHPFEGRKFKTIYDDLNRFSSSNFIRPNAEVSMDTIDEFLSSVMQHRVRNKNGILQAIELPKIPFIDFNFVDRKILSPMRWGVAGTILAANRALEYKSLYWNLSGGYHHAHQQNMEGFCIYNDIGICHQQLIKSEQLKASDEILIIDTDAHHGNGNAYTFLDTPNVKILDIYNSSIYPTSKHTRERVDIPVPLTPRTGGVEYLSKLENALNQLTSGYKLAFVVAGTDVLSTDKLGMLDLSVEDVALRELKTITRLKQLNIPTVVLGGGGYSKDSAQSVIKAIRLCSEELEKGPRESEDLQA